MTTGVDPSIRPAASPSAVSAASDVRASALWYGDPAELAFDEAGCRKVLRRLAAPVVAVRVDGRVGLASDVALQRPPSRDPDGAAGELLARLGPAAAEHLGAPGFRADHGLRFAYMAGAMANGIASEEHVIALGRAGMLGTFGAAGLLPSRVEAAVRRVQEALPRGPYAFNLIHSPAEEALERATVEVYLRQAVRTVETSAFMGLTPHVVRFRVSGLDEAPDGTVIVRNRVIAKLSRREVAESFLSPAPLAVLRDLVATGWISERQARLAEGVPLADDVTVEADSGGHTDNRPLVVLLPSLQALRDELSTRFAYERVPRVGAAGGIGTPHAVAAAFAMGADYVVTGSINQSCVEAATSPHVRELLAQAEFADVAMAPAADMFELGVELQLLKRGTLFPMRARKLYELYRRYDSLDEIPAPERERLERQIFLEPLERVWEETAAYFAARDPEQVARAEADPKRRMALVFRWYLGLSSNWANTGDPGRELDYQVWCGPAMGAFNDWVRGSPLEAPENRRVAEVGSELMTNAAYLVRLLQLEAHGVHVTLRLRATRPREFTEPA
jgi:PfaD family protein